MPEVIKGIFWLLIILSILVVVHEWGHYAMAKWFKMRVEDFSLFFGPVIWRIGQRGETVYHVRSIPLGGFVKIAGMEPDDISGGRPILEAIRHPNLQEDADMDRMLAQLDADTMAGINAENISSETRQIVRSAIGSDGRLTATGRQDLEALRHSPRITADEQRLIEMVLAADTRAGDTGLYSQKPIYQRALVIFAGPLASLVFGFLVFCLMGFTIGLPTNKLTTQIVQVMPGGAGAEAGLRTGDRIVAINGVPVNDGEAMIKKINESAGVRLQLTVRRDGREIVLFATPRAKDVPMIRNGRVVNGPDGKPLMEKKGRLEVIPNPEFARSGPMESIRAGTLMTAGYVVGLYNVVRNRQVKEAVGGPIAMGQMATAFQRLGIEHLVMMMGSLSLSLGIMNLLPIPILDGGHLMLLGWEKLRRRKLSPREVYRAQMIGLGILALLIIFVMFNDISRILAGRSLH